MTTNRTASLMWYFLLALTVLLWFAAWSEASYIYGGFALLGSWFLAARRLSHGSIG